MVLLEFMGAQKKIWINLKTNLVTILVVEENLKKPELLQTLLFFFICIHHAFTYPFSFPFDMCLLEGKHVFHSCLPCFYIMIYMCSP